MSQRFEALKKKDPDLPVAMMTGYVPGGRRETRLPQGIAGLVEKPLIMENVAHVVDEALMREGV